jgi:hypothetical protein
VCRSGKEIHIGDLAKYLLLIRLFPFVQPLLRAHPLLLTSVMVNRLRNILPNALSTVYGSGPTCARCPSEGTMDPRFSLLPNQGDLLIRGPSKKLKPHNGLCKSKQVAWVKRASWQKGGIVKGGSSTLNLKLQRSRVLAISTSAVKKKPAMRPFRHSDTQAARRCRAASISIVCAAK